MRSEPRKILDNLAAGTVAAADNNRLKDCARDQVNPNEFAQELRLKLWSILGLAAAICTEHRIDLPESRAPDKRRRAKHV
jgi:hypothetical protein